VNIGKPKVINVITNIGYNGTMRMKIFHILLMNIAAIGGTQNL
jgi:hypothetical protein